jgi:hypothetical protein
MTDQELELYQRTVADCHAVADSMDPEDGLRRPFRTLAQVLQRRLDREASGLHPRTAQVMPLARPRSPRGQLHAVPTQG